MGIIISLVRVLAKRYGYKLVLIDSTDKPMTNGQIKIAMLEKGIKQTHLIKALKSNKSDISNAIADRDRPELRKKIIQYIKSY